LATQNLREKSLERTVGTEPKKAILFKDIVSTKKRTLKNLRVNYILNNRGPKVIWKCTGPVPSPNLV